MATPDLVTELQLERSLRKQAERERDNARVERDNERKKAEKMVEQERNKAQKMVERERNKAAEKFEQERSLRIRAEKLAREMMVKNGAEFASFIGKKNNVSRIALNHNVSICMLHSSILFTKYVE